MSGTVSAVAPQSHIARFIFGDVKGGEHKHDFAMSVVHTAIEQALKGNCRDIPEAMKFCTGKSVKARAYLAGFHVIADSVKPVAYTGKLADAANAPVRTVIADSARHLACEFELAFLATVENAKVLAKFERDAKAKAKTAPVVAEAGADSANKGAADTLPLPVGEVVSVDIGTSVDAVVQAMDAGMLSAAEIDAIAGALALYNMAKLEREERAAA